MRFFGKRKAESEREAAARQAEERAAAARRREAADREAAAARPLKDALIFRSRYPWTEAEREAMSRPPYPRPPVVEEYERTIESALATVSIPPGGAGPLVATSAIGAVEHLGDMDWQTPAQLQETVLIAVGIISLSDALEIADASDGAGLGPDVLALEFRRQVGLCHLEAGDVDAALDLAPAMGDDAYVAYRDIGAHHARRSDTDAFFSLWKQYAVGTERADMKVLKETLVLSVASAHGWEQGLALCGDRRIGSKFHEQVFRHLAEEGQVATLLELFDGPAADVDEITQLRSLALALSDDSPEAPTVDHPRLSGVLDRVIALDFAESKTTMRSRDDLLELLCPAIGEQTTLDRARKAARSTMTKHLMGKHPGDYL